MQPNSSNYSNHKVHVNPVFSYLANKYAYSSATTNTCNSSQILDRKQSHPSEQSRYRKSDTPFNNYIKGKFYELSAIMYQDSINKATPSMQDTNTLPQQDQNSKYRWKNQKLTSVCDTPLVDESVPFHSVFSKGWFFHNSCDTKCIANSSLDVQSCCFINDRCLPRNTLDTQDLKKRVLDFYKKKTSNSNNHSLISISKHKLIKKTNVPLKETTAVSKSPSQKRKSLNVPLLCTRSKLIRRNKPVAISMSLVKAEKMMKNVSKNFIVKRHSLVRINNASEDIAKTIHKRKRLNSVIMLTKRKLIRKNSPIAQNTSPFVSISKHKLRRKIVENPSPVISTPKPEIGLTKERNEPATSGPDRLISINPNKLVKSSLLPKMTTKSKNEVFFAKSVLFHVIRYRRRSHRGSGYVLLTRNKLIKKAKFKNRIWSRNKSEESSPNNCPDKIFVALGNNKLIRKSLFAKNNKTDAEKKSSQILSPAKNALFARMWNSPSRRIQRFTNHLARTKLRYASERNTYMFKNRFPNKHKNNMRIIRKKKNSICPIYRKKGTCAKLLKGDCFRIHDRKYVALCQNFIRGNCDEKDCLLSHDLSPNKMSVCRRYLKNSCTYENCPYLHTKPALESPICPQFLQGYCESGERCTKWHIFACPEFKESSRCPKEGTCRLPHRDPSYFQGKADESDDEDGFNWRYFEKNKIDEKDNKSISIIPERQLMGDLPDYIPI